MISHTRQNSKHTRDIVAKSYQPAKVIEVFHPATQPLIQGLKMWPFQWAIYLLTWESWSFALKRPIMAPKKGKVSSFCDIDREKCLEPTGKNIGWVFCEACSGWFHCKCVKVDAKRASEDDFIFHCEVCQPIKKKVGKPEFQITSRSECCFLLFRK